MEDMNVRTRERLAEMSRLRLIWAGTSLIPLFALLLIDCWAGHHICTRFSAIEFLWSTCDVCEM